MRLPDWPRTADDSAVLDEIKVGAPSQLLIHTIDIGMLVEPRDRHDFQQQAELQRQYFQTIPVSQLIVSQYAPVHLTEVRFPDDTLLTDFYPSNGDWHNGDMREKIGKQLVAMGINNANYGIYSSPAVYYPAPDYAAHQTVQNSRGRYENGIVVHGGEGYSAMPVLDSTIGNELSHELGHTFGLCHFMGGFAGTVHKDASFANSTWGWDADKNLFIPNFYESISNQETCLDDECIASFYGRAYAKDAMGGGEPTTNSLYTLYSPHSMNKIQQYFESKIVFDSTSPTGFWRWNKDEQKKKYVDLLVDKEQIVLGQNNSTMSHLEQALADSDIVRVTYSDGNWQAAIHVPPARLSNKEKILVISSVAGYSSTIHINSDVLSLETNNK